MARPKAQTLQQRFGFMDDDLKKPKHDEIMLWLNSYIDENLAEWLGIPKNWSDDEITKLREASSAERENRIGKLRQDLDQLKYRLSTGKLTTFTEPTLFDLKQRHEQQIQEQEQEIIRLERQMKCMLGKIHKMPIPEKPPIQIVKKDWERPIKSRDYIIGFIDMMVIYEQPFLSMFIELTDQGWVEKWTVIQKSYTDDGENRIHFEVKTEIPSLGELIRQINMYRTYGAGRFFVVTPNNSFAQVLEEQGIGLIKFP